MSKVWELINTDTLVYGGTFEDQKTSICAKIFGTLIKLAEGRVEHYRGDLFHDALWLSENITGAMSFDWVARESGTFIGEVCLHVKDDEWANTARYRFSLRVEGNSKWVLETRQSVECPDLGAKYRDKMQEEFVLPDEFHPYFSNEPLPESVMDAVENMDVNPINSTIDLLFQAPVPEQSWADRHAALDITECDVAFAVEGCIFHPAPVNGWTNEHVTVQEIPTLRNDLTTEPSALIRKENKMESIIRDLREKYEEASNSKDQLEEYQSNINDAVDQLEEYMSDLDSLIDSLDSLPEVSVYCDLDTVSFDS